jgi:hypothetical protein
MRIRVCHLFVYTSGPGTNIKICFVFQDDMGRHEVGFIENTIKTPLGADGCLFEAKFHVNKVPGNFHLSTHSVDVQPDEYDFAHEIHEVTFGTKIRKISSKKIRSSFNPLKDRSKMDGNSLGGWCHVFFSMQKLSLRFFLPHNNSDDVDSLAYR